MKHQIRLSISNWLFLNKKDAKSDLPLVIFNFIGFFVSKSSKKLSRYDASEVEAPPPLQYDSSIDERDLTVDEWRKALWEEVTNWTPHPGYNNPSQPQMETE